MSIKRDLLLVIGTFVITSSSIVACNQNDKKTATTTTESNAPSDGLASTDIVVKFELNSEPITWDDAKAMKTEYLTGFDKAWMVKHNGRDGSGATKNQKLEGFVIDAAHLDEIINHNHYGNGDSAKADQVVFYFGKKGEEGSGRDKHAKMHIIAVGLKDDKLMNTAAGTDKKTGKAYADASIFDKAESCPPFGASEQ
ncbi:hypothetical protein [Segetibacter aerophilus]|uniref:Lipoprotein n=1 Tax=Segetibacter aerophilus TaxID=670293 RepID=A0A512B8K4_9BACT|nr:hypothetical protein [Segetibacter aerophilus]GEO08292.1 hypothetical protein SAE01_07880 [Segetibacter aerophilus]